MATTTEPADILMPALENLVERSGYFGIDAALDDLRAVLGHLDVDPPAPA